MAAQAKDRTHSQLFRLKQKLLHATLEQTPEEIFFKPICGAANQATDLAWESPCPLLVFPCLFEELVQAVREQRQPKRDEAKPGMDAITEALKKQEATGSKTTWPAESSPNELAENVSAVLAAICNINYTIFKNDSHRYTWQFAHTIEGVRGWLFAQKR